MKKINLVFLLILLLVTSCGLNKKSDETDLLEYSAYYKAINENENFKYTSEYYSINAELVKSDNEKYLYYISIDNPKIAMYDIKVLAIDKDTTYTQGIIDSPSIGIIADKTYSLIPFQVYKENGYYKGLSLSGETLKNELDIELLITWYNSERDKSYKEFITFTLNENGMIIEHDDLQGN